MKKTMSVFLCAVIAVSAVFAFPAQAFSQNASSAVIEFSVCDAEMFTLRNCELTVTSELSDIYAEQIGANDSSAEPTILDAVIAAHIAMFGDKDFEGSDYLTVSGGMFISAFGENTSAISYRKNGLMPNGFSETVSSGDYIEFAFYQTSYYGDSYTYFSQRESKVFVNQSVNLTLNAESYDSNWNPCNAPVPNAAVTCYDPENYIDKVIGTTDENGSIALSFTAPGIYEISVSEDTSFNGEPVFLPYARITVANTDVSNYISKQLKNGASYCIEQSKAAFTESLNASNAIAYLAYLKAGYDMSEYNSSFAELVKSNLEDNSGKLMQSSYSGTAEENIALYGAVIQILDITGLNPELFEGYNIISAFKEMESPDCSSPYFLRVAVEAAYNHCENDFAKSLIDYSLENYSMSNGFSYYGYSSDNDSMFLTALSYYKDDYKIYVNDALRVLDKYKKEQGYFGSEIYTPDANADSTALAIMAYSSVGEKENASQAYVMLCENFESKISGVFCTGGAENVYATNDCVIALSYFKDFVDENVINDIHISDNNWTVITNPTCYSEGKEESTCKICSSSIVKSVEKLPHDFGTNNKSCSVCNTENPNYAAPVPIAPSVPVPSQPVAVAEAPAEEQKKTTVKKPGKATIKKLVKGKKSFKITWKKVSSVSGYQVQYSTSKKFTKKTTSSKYYKGNKKFTKTISKLKSKKTYYVRVRAYKTVNGKKVYGSWSKVKSVKTK